MATAASYVSRLKDLPHGSIEAITGNENLLILAPYPGDESLCCGGLIAELCRRGRPPFVMVLGDGSASGPNAASYSADHLARVRERETRLATERLGLPPTRLLMVGLLDGAIPSIGPVFEAVVRAVALVMWARDCNVVCAPAPYTPDPAHRATHDIAKSVAAETGVGHLSYVGYGRKLPPDMILNETMAGWRLDISLHLATKQAAIGMFGERWAPEMLGTIGESNEVYLSPLNKT